MFVKKEVLHLTLEQFKEIVNNPYNNVLTWLDFHVHAGNCDYMFDRHREGDTVSVEYVEYLDEDYELCKEYIVYQNYLDIRS